MISVCTLLLSTLHQCNRNITEIKPQAKLSPQFGLFNSEKPSAFGALRPPDPLLYNYQFLGPAITKHSVTPLVQTSIIILNNYYITTIFLELNTPGVYFTPSILDLAFKQSRCLFKVGV